MWRSDPVAATWCASSTITRSQRALRTAGRDFRSLDEIDRRDDHRLDDRRVDPDGQSGAAACDFAHVEQRGGEVETRSEPFTHCSRRPPREDQHARRGAAGLELGRDQRGLNRLAEADFVGDQQRDPVPRTTASTGSSWCGIRSIRALAAVPSIVAAAVAGDELAAGRGATPWGARSADAA